MESRSGRVRRPAARIAVGAVIILLLLAIGALCYRGYRQTLLDKDLIAAIKRTDAGRVEELIALGANPATCTLERRSEFEPVYSRSRSLWDRFCDVVLRRKPEPEPRPAIFFALGLRDLPAGNTASYPVERDLRIVTCLLSHGGNVYPKGRYGSAADRLAWSTVEGNFCLVAFGDNHQGMTVEFTRLGVSKEEAIAVFRKAGLREFHWKTD